MPAKYILSIVPLSLMSTFSCGSLSAIFVESHEITSGSFRGITIGMTRMETLVSARKLGASVVSAIPCPYNFETDSQLISPPPEGLRITDDRSYFDIYFRNNSVENIISSPTGKFPLGVNIGDSAAQANDKIRYTTLNYSKIRVHSIVRNEYKSIYSPSYLDKNMINSHDCWEFEITNVKPSGESYDLTFKGSNLAKLSYRRARINVE